MADKEIKLKVTTETEISPLEELDNLVDDLLEKLHLKVDVEDDEIEDATDKASELSDELDNVNDANPSIDVDDSSVEDATDKAGELGDALDEIDGKEVSVNVDTSQIENANESLEETDNSLNNIKTTLVGLVATAEIEHMATVADNVNNSWNRLELTFEGTGLTMDVLKDKVSEVNAETSRGAGVVREYFNQMGIAGVTNADLLADSFESLSGKAYQLDSSIESMEVKMQTMVLTGSASTKMLKSLGLSAEDLANAIGVSVDELSDAFSELSPEQRLQAITTAMGDGATANAMYGDSYEAMKQKAENAMSGLEGAVGQAILPNVIPALDLGTQAVKGLTEGFKGLPEPVQGAIGTVLGVGAIATTGIGMFGEFAGAIANLGDAYGVLKDVYKALIPTEYAEGIAGWFSIGWIAAAILLGIALGLAFVYLYENCDWFREAVDNLAATLSELASIIQSTIMDVINGLRQQFEDFTAQLGLNTNDWKQAVLGFILFIPQLPLRLGIELANALMKALGFKTDFISYITNAAKQAVSNFTSWIVGIYNKFREEVDKILAEAGRLARELPPKIAKSGLGALGSWIDTTGEKSPGYMYDAFTGELQAMRDAPARYSIGMNRNMQSLAEATSGGFNLEFANGGSSSSSGGAGMVNNFYFSDIVVDNDERMEKIYDYITKQLNWDNTTAGRTV